MSEYFAITMVVCLVLLIVYRLRSKKQTFGKNIHFKNEKDYYSTSTGFIEQKEEPRK